MENRKPKAMISQPMAGLTDDKIALTRKRAVTLLESLGFEVVNTLHTDEWYQQDRKNKPLMFLAKSIDNMADVDLVFFCEGWINARGCKIEYEIAQAYGIPCLEAV